MLNDVAGTEVDLVKMRNPHGRGEITTGLTLALALALTPTLFLTLSPPGEITTGEFDDDGPGWAAYPQIAAELQHVAADDGIFWLTKQELF